MPDRLEPRLFATLSLDPHAISGIAGWDEYLVHREERLAEMTPEQRELLPRWLDLGQRNPWILEAWDPPFSVVGFRICHDFRSLAEDLLKGNWCVGQAFVYEQLCFINQIDGGDEWLTIKGRTAFESITMCPFGETLADCETRLSDLVQRFLRATEEQCRRLDY